MRQLAGTLVVFSFISCAAASEVVDLDEPPSVTTLPEVTVEGTAAKDVELDPASFCPEGKTCALDEDALKKTTVALAAPFVDARAVAVKDERGGETMLVVRTEDGAWRPVQGSFLSWFEDDPGCPSIERESAIAEVRAVAGSIVVVTKSDRASSDDEATLETTNARACRIDEDDAFECGDAEVVSADVVTYDGDDRRVKRSFTTRWWLDADGEIEVDRPFSSWHDQT